MDSESLVAEYRLLRTKILQAAAEETSSNAHEERLDAIYARIVARPVVDVGGALEKLWFAHHCLTEEDDFKEATNLIYQVCLALELITRKAGPDASVA